MGKREVVEGKNRGARKIRRQQLGKLKDLVVQPQTKRRYEDALKRFFEFLRWNRFKLPSKYDEVDRLAAMFVEQLWDEGDSKYLAQDTLSGLQHFEPQLKRRLLQSWRLIRAWRQHEIPTRAPPFTPTTLAVLAGWMQQRRPDFALAIVLAFHALLRTGELMQIKNKDIICSGDLVVVHLGQTKTSVRNAGTESSSFRDPKISLMLRAWKSVNRPQALLVNSAPSSFRQFFAQGLEETKLHVIPYKPYSLRRGGATDVFLKTQSYASVCQRGRWSSEKTTRIYIQDSVALLTELRDALTPKQREYHDSWQSLLHRLEHPSDVTGRKGGRGK